MVGFTLSRVPGQSDVSRREGLVAQQSDEKYTGHLFEANSLIFLVRPFNSANAESAIQT